MLFCVHKLSKLYNWQWNKKSVAAVDSQHCWRRKKLPTTKADKRRLCVPTLLARAALCYPFLVVEWCLENFSTTTSRLFCTIQSLGQMHFATHSDRLNEIDDIDTLSTLMTRKAHSLIYSFLMDARVCSFSCEITVTTAYPPLSFTCDFECWGCCCRAHLKGFHLLLVLVLPLQMSKQKCVNLRQSNVVCLVQRQNWSTLTLYSFVAHFCVR